MVGKPIRSLENTWTPKKESVGCFFCRKKSSSPTQFCVYLCPFLEMVGENVTRILKGFGGNFQMPGRSRQVTAGFHHLAPGRVTGYFMGRWAPLFFHMEKTPIGCWKVAAKWKPLKPFGFPKFGHFEKPFHIPRTRESFEKKRVPSLKLTAKAPENGWLKYDCFLLGPGLFARAFWVSLQGVFFPPPKKEGAIPSTNSLVSPPPKKNGTWLLCNWAHRHQDLKARGKTSTSKVSKKQTSLNQGWSLDP